MIGESTPQQVLLFSVGARYFFSPAPPFGPNIVASGLDCKSTNRWVISVSTWLALIPPFSNGGTLAPSSEI